MWTEESPVGYSYDGGKTVICYGCISENETFICDPIYDSDWDADESCERCGESLIRQMPD